MAPLSLPRDAIWNQDWKDPLGVGQARILASHTQRHENLADTACGVFWECEAAPVRSPHLHRWVFFLQESSGHSSESRRNLTRGGLGQLKRGGCGPGPQEQKQMQERREKRKMDEEGRGGLTQIKSRNCPQQEKGQKQ